MKRIGKLFGKVFGRAAALVLAITMLLAAVPSADTGVVEAVETDTRTIGILFDNSGSMYKHSDWCRALYAMETFAAMANEGDRILIYPMHAITVGVVTDEEIEAGDVTYYTSTSPLEIICGDEESVAQIREIYTPEPGETPIESLEEAYEGLMQEDGEKWFLVLTDGYEFDRDGSTLSDSEGELSELLSGFLENLNVMYLGIGSSAVDPDISADSDYVSQVTIASDSAEVLSDMIAMCNTIYGRSEAELSEDTFELTEEYTDVTILMQGSDVSDVALADSDGDAVAADSTTYALSYSTTGQGKTKKYYDSMSSDEDLVGVLVTYENVPAGTYTLNYDGSPDSISVSASAAAAGSESGDGESSDGADGSEGAADGTEGTDATEGADGNEGTDAAATEGEEGAEGTESAAAAVDSTEGAADETGSDDAQNTELSTEPEEADSGHSSSGNHSGADQEDSTHSNPLAANARWIAMGFILALEIFIILWLLMHQKVFPNRIMVDQTYYVVDGEEMAGEATVEGGRNLDGNTSQITIHAPEVPEQPNLEFGITFDLKPVDYRCMKGALRRVEITNVTGGTFATSQVTDGTIAAREITWDADSKSYAEETQWDTTAGKKFGYTVGSMRRYRLHGVAHDGDREMEVELSFVLLHK